MSLKLSAPGTQQFWDIPVLFEDDHLLAVDKPAGLATVSDAADSGRTSLLSLLHQGISEAKPWATTRGLSFLMNAHRLDPEASGVLLLAKTKPVLVQLLDWFGSERSGLSFVTLINGTPSQDRFSVEAKIAADPERADVMRLDSRHGKRARTVFEVVERFQAWTLVKAMPLTHRPHQIRLHLVRAGLRVAGDATYRGNPLLLSSLKSHYRLKPKQVERPLIGQPCVHAAQLTLAHPATGAPLVIEAPWPKDLLVALKYLRKYAPVG